MSCTFGVFLNMGANLGPTAADVFDLTARQAELAEDAGLHDLWVTEHHFIRFGINPSALTTAGFLLGRTRRIRVGTAVVLSPLLHPVDLAERVALLDQFGEGRFDLGLGRGGYLRDYEVLGVDTERWDDEPQASVRALLDLWQPVDERLIEPAVRTRPHPPILLATSTDAGLAVAARHGFALQHYFAAPAAARVAVQERYAAMRAAVDDRPPADHLHTLIAIVTGPGDDPAAVRARLAGALTESFHAGDHPHVPNVRARHVGPDGKPLSREDLAAGVAAGAIVGPPAQVVDELGAFVEAVGARRVAVYHEAAADPELTLASIERFAGDVVPQLTVVPDADA